MKFCNNKNEKKAANLAIEKLLNIKVNDSNDIKNI